MVDEQLAQLGRMSGVLGSCLCTRDGQVLAAEMPDIYEAVTLEHAALLVAEAYLGVESIRDNVAELDFVFQDYLCIVRPVGADRILYVICEPDVKTPILKLSLNVAAKKLAVSLSGMGGSETARGVKSTSTLRASAYSSHSEDEVDKTLHGVDDDLLEQKSVADVIAAIQEELGKSMGDSVAKIIVDTAMDAAGVDRKTPNRAQLRVALNELLNKALSTAMGKNEAIRWLNDLLAHHGLARRG